MGILEFKTLLTEEAFDISQKMIAEVFEKCKLSENAQEW